MDLQPSADAEALTNRVAGMIDAGRTGPARPLLAALRSMTAPSVRLAELAARLALCDGDLDEAQAELDTAIGTSPPHAGLYKLRADLRRRRGETADAAQDAAAAVMLDRHDPVAKALLGVLLLDLGQPQNAVLCLHEAVAAVPTNAFFREGLAAAQCGCGDFDAAATTLAGGIAAAPGRVALRNAAILLEVRRHDFEAAVGLAETARQAGVADACVFGLKGHALSSLGRHVEAADAYTEALKLRPDDPYVRHLVAASGSVASADRAPTDYLRAVFDGYADHFELHLISLGYRIPGLIRAALLRHLDLCTGERIGPVLDLGCGTGLVAVAIADLPIGPLTGVDLSPHMLARAAEKQVYAELREADMMTLLAETRQSWRVILAADVLCYIGALDQAFVAVHEGLRPGGWFICSLELPPSEAPIADDSAWGLGGKCRYMHREDYVRQAALAAGFAIREIAYETQRREADIPVPGLLLVLQRTRDDG
jgi:predicted TPR repeat methyltransferase